MATIYQEQPATSDGSAVGLVAGLVLVLAVIALVFLATRAAPTVVPSGSTGEIDVNVPQQPSGSIQLDRDETTIQERDLTPSLPGAGTTETTPTPTPSTP